MGHVSRETRSRASVSRASVSRCAARSPAAEALKPMERQEGTGPGQADEPGEGIQDRGPTCLAPDRLAMMQLCIWSPTQELEEREKVAASSAAQAAEASAAVAKASKRAQRRAAKREQLAALRQGVVAVAVLPKLKPQQSSGSTFVKKALAARPRSVAMLAARRRHGPALKFT
jgi:hypothetical protein